MSLAKSDLMWEKMTVSSLLIWDVEAKTVGEILYYPPPPIRPASSQVTAILGHKWRPCLNLSTKLPPWQCFARRWLDQHLIRAHFGSGQCDVSLWQNTGVGVNRVPMSLRSSLKLMDKWRLYRFVWVCPSLLSRKSFALKGNPATPEQNAFLLGKIRKLQIQKIVTKTCLIRKYSVWICVEKAILFLQTMNHCWNLSNNKLLASPGVHLQVSADTRIVFSGLVEPALGEIGYVGLCCVWSEKGSFVKIVTDREVYATSVEKRRRNESIPRWWKQPIPSQLRA